MRLRVQFAQRPGTSSIGTVARIEVRKNELAVRLKLQATEGADDQEERRVFPDADDEGQGSRLRIAWHKPPSKKAREILLPANVSRHHTRPIKPERRAALIKSIARGRAWLDELVTGAADGVEQIAARNKCSIRHVNMTISMAFVAPALVTAAIEGRLPRGIRVASLRDAPAEWSHQLTRLGLA